MTGKILFSFCAILSIFISACFAAEQTPQQALLAELGCEKALIMNGDDLGRSKWSNEGILKAFREGILTSTSLMTANLAANEAYELIKQNPDLDVGVHFVLARDDAPGNLFPPLSPIDKVPHLVGDKGYFITDINWLIANVPKKEMGIELSAQTLAAYDHGVDVTHMDCHKGFYHLYDKKSVSVATKLAAKYDLPIRWTGRTTDAVLKKNGIIVPDFTTMVNMRDPYESKKEKFLKMLSDMKPGITEVVFHPATGGFSEDEARDRMGDLALALDPDVRNAIEENGICLLGYRRVRDFQRKWRQQHAGD
ncbi:MAG TPA: ChbG/HpnK family deacetylase [bacterium]|nr:ChbG/HpnK family deacetylase [bacterium]